MNDRFLSDPAVSIVWPRMTHLGQQRKAGIVRISFRCAPNPAISRADGRAAQVEQKLPVHSTRLDGGGGCKLDIRAGIFRTGTTNRLGSGSSNSFGNEIGRCGQGACSVVGSIILRTSVILVAGKPLTSACFFMIASSLAR